MTVFIGGVTFLINGTLVIKDSEAHTERVRARARARKSLRTMPPKKSAAKKTASKKSIKKAAKAKSPPKPALAQATTLAETVKGEKGSLRTKSRNDTAKYLKSKINRISTK